MKLPIKYRLYNNRLWVRWGLDEVWKEVRTTTNKKVTPITQNFGADFVWNLASHPEWKGRWFYKDIIGIDGHNGIDFEAPTGTRLYAPHDGVITELLIADGYGIRLQGAEYSSIFYHLKEFHCSLNQEVKQGDFIALTDNTGRYTTAPHLHWGVKGLDGKYFDHRGFIEDLDIVEFPYKEGQCFLVKPDGQFYVYESGDLIYYDSDKQPDRHIPIVDFFIKKNKEGLPPNFIKVLDISEFNKFNNLIK
ncbi:M23 family metallopeptidase [Candidatus Dojkabacteria bacterium]|jgi:murein DD-endopeptidase MepM/ murein hydrolase activator NlpD|nr:M23 family metallopeptidase [Candidatus Dojkabacteria bacterium]